MAIVLRSAAMQHNEAGRVSGNGLAQPIPLYVRFRSQGDPIVGTSIDYFAFRGLKLAAGRQMTRLGDCVLGSEVARRRGVGPGGFPRRPTRTPPSDSPYRIYVR